MKWTNFFRSKPIQVCLFLIYGFLFIWPFLAPLVVSLPQDLFLYLFSAWVVVLFLAFITSTACRHDPVLRQKPAGASNAAAAAETGLPDGKAADEKPFRRSD